jgi:hypothetical protein
MRPSTIGYHLLKKWLAMGGPPEANGGRREDVVAMCQAIDEYRKSAAGVRRDKAKNIMVSLLPSSINQINQFFNSSIWIWIWIWI